MPEIRLARDPGTLITFQGREYDLRLRLHINDLADRLGISRIVSDLHESRAPRGDVIRVIWQAVLSRLPGSLDGE